MPEALQFDKKAIEQYEKDYSRLNLKPTSKQYIDNFAKLYSRYLPISELAMKGFISFAMRDFQVKTHIETTEILQQPIEQRQKHFETLKEIFLEKLTKILVKPQQRAQLEAALQEVNKMLARM